jgi:hypothetical protein
MRARGLLRGGALYDALSADGGRAWTHKVLALGPGTELGDGRPVEADAQGRAQQHREQAGGAGMLGEEGKHMQRLAAGIQVSLTQDLPCGGSAGGNGVLTNGQGQGQAVSRQVFRSEGMRLLLGKGPAQNHRLGIWVWRMS